MSNEMGSMPMGVIDAAMLQPFKEEEREGKGKDCKLHLSFPLLDFSLIQL